MNEEEIVMNFGELQVQGIEMVQGAIRFMGFDQLKASAIKLADQIATLEVTEDNVKLSKKLLAEVNKRVEELEGRRKKIKNAMMEPYQAFENQVKEIVTIVKDADALVRSQVKEMEQKEREEKEIQIHEIWMKRIAQYSFKDMVPFMDFAKPKHLNKTTSIVAVETEMIQFLEKVESDMQVLLQMPEVDNHINAYLNTYDLGQALTIVKQEQERKAKIQLGRKNATPERIGYLVSIQVHNEKELKLLEIVLKENGFEFSTDKVEI
jgi:hypothetical protein